MKNASTIFKAFRITHSKPYGTRGRITVDLIGWENGEIRSLWREHFPEALQGLSDARLTIEMSLYEPYNDSPPCWSFPRVTCSGGDYKVMSELVELGKALAVIQKKLDKIAQTRGDSTPAEYVMRMAEVTGATAFLTMSKSGSGYYRSMTANDARYHLEHSMREGIEALAKPKAPVLSLSESVASAVVGEALTN